MSATVAPDSPSSCAQALGFGITCLDAAYVEPGLACLYLLEQDGEYAVLETGTSHSVPRLQAYLREHDIHPEQIRYIIPTHVHLDHAGGAGAMLALCPAAQLLVHPRGARHLVDPAKLVAAATAVYGQPLFEELYGAVVPVSAARIREVQNGESIALAGRSLTFVHTRGHADHHFCVWDEVSHGWFSGDMFGVSYPWCRFPSSDFVLPSTTPSQFDPQAYHDSLQLLASYQPQRMYLTHSGELRYSHAVTGLLQRQISDYCAIAARHANDEPALQQALSEYTMALCLQLDGSADTDGLRARLAFDMRLNAQGLALWQQRRSR